MKNSIYNFLDYRDFIGEFIINLPGRGRGFKLKLAEHLSCQPSYVSQVLAKDTNFSLEQAEHCLQILRLTEVEGHFFMLLVGLCRAGTKSLKAYYLTQINKILKERTNLKDSIDNSEALSPEKQAVYYSNWLYAAIHMLTTIPGIKSREQIASRFGIETAAVGKILEFLELSGLVIFEKGQFKATQKRVFVNRESPIAFQHHASWRRRALESVDRMKLEDFFYSGVHSIAKKDINLLVEQIRKLIIELRETIKNSPEEDLIAINIDILNL